MTLQKQTQEKTSPKRTLSSALDKFFLSFVEAHKDERVCGDQLQGVRLQEVYDILRTMMKMLKKWNNMQQ
jgi:hypothetical protein